MHAGTSDRTEFCFPSLCRREDRGRLLLNWKVNLLALPKRVGRCCRVRDHPRVGQKRRLDVGLSRAERSVENAVAVVIEPENLEDQVGAVVDEAHPSWSVAGYGFDVPF